MVDRNDITELLNRSASGDAAARDELWRVILAELHELARRRLARERSDHTLRPTELVNEAYLKLQGSAGTWSNRAHFFAAAANAMRQILVDHARGHRQRDELQDVVFEIDDDKFDVEAFDVALRELAAAKGGARPARVVELRFFAGLSNEEIAELLGVSLATVKRAWDFARTSLRARMSEGGKP